MHQSRRFLTAVMLLAAVAGMVGAAYAQQQEALTIKDILAKAECPLTEDQGKKLSAVKIGGDFSVFQEINTMFTEPQTTALKGAFGSSPGFDGEEQPRMLFFAIIFENEGCPFSAEQVAKIKALNGDDPMAMFGEMQNIFNEKQNGVMQAMMPPQ